MIGSDRDEGIVENAGGFEFVEQCADQCIRVSDLAVVQITQHRKFRSGD